MSAPKPEPPPDADNVTHLVTLEIELNVNMNFEPLPESALCYAEPTLNVKPKKPSLPEKPVTFHKKIKSSGYGPSKAKPTKPKLSQMSKPIYPTNAPHPSYELSTNSGCPLHAGPVYCVRYSNNGNKLATCGGDRVGNILKVTSRLEPQTLVGHELPLTSIAWSASSKLVASTSLDNTIKLWNVAGEKAGECLWTGPGDFNLVQFYYLDRFICASQGNKVLMYRYKLKDPQLKDDVKRLASKCSAKAVARATHPDAQAVSRFAAHNMFHSHLILLGGSNRSVAVWDANVQQIAANFDHGHRRPMHSLRLFESSQFIPETDADWYNLFLTAAPDNTIKLFDLRHQQEVMCLSGHVNTGLNLGAAISPCGRFIASGSEDRAAYIWDIRSTNILEKLRGFRETVGDVAFNPATTQLVAGSLDGCIRFFGLPPKPQTVKRGGMRTRMADA
mmetsp:Transcript_33999/g.59250  ORF Transcript_33999/g.59250 Transcript_33999/m.59250 type:complete len:446 (+) Transcript_33999:919-2256(+)|eukprot:CAMPEP_0204910930 /NCGR_PEP_ID=MMETSP1397-20131031/9368_1 /ASSEMBLY_ACC=CAM_ASM_000891 /TAXON_ID=49980 /ORGANISM="Climacostomum Climacostomum virens, Strain Stock W-24" /LENGTH=445 /DNA_ID=CAMNT_0052081285 /DNA_START=193 /DNA_END=1530 /DNA_ORIENTATION=+